MTDHSYFGVNSPLFLTFYALLMIGFGIWAVATGIVGYRESGDGAALGASAAALAIVVVGLHAFRMGIARMKWKREYERVMGRSPFQ